MTVWTIGHSTRPLDELVALLRAHAIATVVDVRTAPRSRRHPHFSKETLAANTRLAMMCAEAAPDHCHRSLLSDALVVRGVRVLHITGDGEPATHAVTAWAHRDGLRLTYPPRQRDLLFG